MVFGENLELLGGVDDHLVPVFIHVDAEFPFALHLHQVKWNLQPLAKKVPPNFYHLTVLLGREAPGEAFVLLFKVRCPLLHLTVPLHYLVDCHLLLYRLKHKLLLLLQPCLSLLDLHLQVFDIESKLLILFLSAILFFYVFILLVIDNMTFILGDDVEGTEHVQGIIDSPLHILEVYFLTELLVEFEDFVGNLGAGGHWLASDLIKHGSAQKHQFLIFLLLPIFTFFIRRRSFVVFVAVVFLIVVVYWLLFFFFHQLLPLRPAFKAFEGTGLLFLLRVDFSFP
mmetsp:Transcript_5997/g.5403  ORF Transcript_5997/g.5403 Transcript_5997/m.5403 type:complete len:283 (-) Transcript_5997:334-1182(-)